ncbi:MAG: hypothetical protein AB7P04_11285 [Bacteriovoracia bacterium]
MEAMMMVVKMVVIVGVVWGAAQANVAHGAPKASMKKAPPPPKVIFKEQTKLDFEGLQIEGQLDDPGEFYFQHRPQEKFDSLVKRRKNFHREMLRDVVLSK